MKPPCIVVFRANDVCHLGVIRTLAALGINFVNVIWDWPGAPKFYSDQSKLLGRVFHISNPGSDPIVARDDIQKLLIDLADEYGTLPLLMPTSDSILSFLLDSPSIWSFARLANAWNFEATSELLDKLNLSKRIQFSPIKQPHTRRCTKESLMSMRLPFIVKPAKKDPVNSFYAEFFGAKAICVRTEDERQVLMLGDLEERYPLVVQEYIDPTHQTQDMPVYLATDEGGNIIHRSSVEKIFVHPSGFGTAYVVKERSNHIVDDRILKSFVELTNVRGLVMLEFIKGPDGEFYFIEANPRPWLLIDFQRLRGRNFFHYLDSCSPRNLPEIISKSTYYIELTGLCASYEALYADSLRCKVLETLSSFEGHIRLSTFDENDPGPMAYEFTILGERYGRDFVADIKNIVGH